MKNEPDYFICGFKKWRKLSKITTFKANNDDIGHIIDQIKGESGMRLSK